MFCYQNTYVVKIILHFDEMYMKLLYIYYVEKYLFYKCNSVLWLNTIIEYVLINHVSSGEIQGDVIFHKNCPLNLLAFVYCFEHILLVHCLESHFREEKNYIIFFRILVFFDSFNIAFSLFQVLSAQQ